jgi:catechol 2,3-dioxygenase-like lactoylglutathione lyase family enzyme
MSDLTQSPTTVNNLGVAMFTVSDVDASIDFFTSKLGYEVRSDVSFGEGDQGGRWVEVAPPGSTARLALNPPMNGEPGGSSIGVESPDPGAERERLASLGIEVGDLMSMPGTPTMFSFQDPDGNFVWVVGV